MLKKSLRRGRVSIPSSQEYDETLFGLGNNNERINKALRDAEKNNK